MSNFNRIAVVAFFTFTIVYIIGLFIPVTEVDSAQYASISREMADEGHWLQVMHRHQNYLDKPPLVFWLSALLFKLFGVSTFLFKLPSFLFTLGGVYAVYRFGSSLYNKQTGITSALLLYGCQAWYLFNNDVRTDTILASAVIISVWQLYEYIEGKKFVNLVIGFVFIALAMLSKGPLGLVIPAMALWPYLLYKRDFKNIFNPMWIIGLLIVSILLSPMVVGLYQQYGVAGPKFFFWTQSFGRITGENVWKNDTGYFFFVHTYLWAFLPGSILTLYEVQEKIRAIVKSKMNVLFANNVLLLAGFILPFIALSLSHYKLPHYIYVVFPFAALLAGSGMQKLPQKIATVFTYLHLIVAAVAIVLVCIFCGIFFPTYNVLLWILIVGSIALIIWLFKGDSNVKILFPALFGVWIFNMVYNVYVYPQLMQYHSNLAMAEYINTHHIPTNKVFYYRDRGHAFDFYTRQITPLATIAQMQQTPVNIWVTTDEQGLKEIEGNGVAITDKIPFQHYHIVMLTGKFLNRETREETLEKKYLLHISH